MKKNTKKSLYFIIILCFILVMSVIKKEFMMTSDFIRPFQIEDGGSHFHLYRKDPDVDKYIENWYANFYNSSNDYNGFISFTLFGNLEDKNYMPGKVFISLVIFHNNSKISINDDFPLSVYNSSEHITDLRIDRNRYAALDRDTFNIYYISKDGKLVLNLTYKRMNEGFTSMHVKEFWSVPIPLASVKGRIINNGSVFNIDGYGYNDHGLTTSGWGEGHWKWLQFELPDKNMTIIYSTYNNSDYIIMVDGSEFRFVAGSNVNMKIKKPVGENITFPENYYVIAWDNDYEIEFMSNSRTYENINSYIVTIASCSGKVSKNGVTTKFQDVPCLIDHKIKLSTINKS
jgi:hypothetical protein